MPDCFDFGFSQPLEIQPIQIPAQHDNTPHNTFFFLAYPPIKKQKDVSKCRARGSGMTMVKKKGQKRKAFEGVEGRESGDKPKENSWFVIEERKGG